MYLRKTQRKNREAYSSHSETPTGCPTSRGQLRVWLNLMGGINFPRSGHRSQYVNSGDTLRSRRHEAAVASRAIREMVTVTRRALLVGSPAAPLTGPPKLQSLDRRRLPWHNLARTLHTAGGADREDPQCHGHPRLLPREPNVKGPRCDAEGADAAIPCRLRGASPQARNHGAGAQATPNVEGNPYAVRLVASGARQSSYEYRNGDGLSFDPLLLYQRPPRAQDLPFNYEIHRVDQS